MHGLALAAARRPGAVRGLRDFPDPAATRESAEQMVARSFSAPAPSLARAPGAGPVAADLQQDRRRQAHAGGSRGSGQARARIASSIRHRASSSATGRPASSSRTTARATASSADASRQRKENGGLCQNCHALAPGEINVGNIGPSLTGYGAQRGNSEAIAKFTYEKIYNALGLLPVLEHAAARGERAPHARADRPPGRVSDRPAVSGEQEIASHISLRNSKERVIALQADQEAPAAAQTGRRARHARRWSTMPAASSSRPRNTFARLPCRRPPTLPPGPTSPRPSSGSRDTPPRFRSCWK